MIIKNMQYDTSYSMSHHVSPKEIHELNNAAGLRLSYEKLGKL